MTPEELEATREGANVDYAPDIAYEDWQAMARALLAHIDSQAVTINNLAAALDEAKVDQVNFSSACQEELDTQAGQIEAMKEKLVEVKAIGLFNSPWDSGLPDGCGYDAEMAACRDEAHQQLKADPDLQKAGVVWDRPRPGQRGGKQDHPAGMQRKRRT